VGDATIHFDRFEVERGEKRIQLTTKEAALLRVLVEREGEAVPRGDLLQEVWGLRPDTRTRVVDSFIVRLRRYLEPDPARPRHIVSVRGHGYRFVR
jgi:DNA-binding response OmpR family regulator